MNKQPNPQPVREKGKRTLMDEARSIAWKNHVPIETALMWARMPIDGRPK